MLSVKSFFLSATAKARGLISYLQSQISGLCSAILALVMPSDHEIQIDKGTIDRNTSALKKAITEKYPKTSGVQHKGAPQLIADVRITVEQQFSALNDKAANALQNAQVRQLIIGEHITGEQFSTLNSDALTALEYADVRQLIIGGRITGKQFIALKSYALTALEYADVRQLIIGGHITGEQFSTLSFDKCRGLQDADVRQLISAGSITGEQFIALKYYALMALQYAQVRQLIIGGHITGEQFSTLIFDACRALREAHVRKLIIDGGITGELFSTLNHYACMALREAHVVQLIFARRITPAQLTLINSHELYEAITNQNTVQRILAGELNVADIIGRPTIAIQRNAFNATQNTHTTSVNESASESATKLYERYNNQIKGDGLQAAITSLVNNIYAYPNPVMATYNNRQRDCLPTAKTCITRITATGYDYEDPVSKISLRTLLALISVAIKDSAALLGGTIDDAMQQIIKALYEIEHGVNIDNPHQDNENTISSSICPPGTFNKIIEKLVGIHPDCNIVFINKDTVALKTRIIVIENIAKYIENAKLPDKFFESYKNDVIFSDDDWISIWDAIKDTVKNDIIAYHAQDNVIAPRVLTWINDNMEGYGLEGCLLTRADMQQISKILSERNPEKPVTSMYTYKMKRSASLDDVRRDRVIGTSRPRSHSN